jgi:hypothetical protein
MPGSPLLFSERPGTAVSPLGRTVEETYIVRRCRHRECRLLAVHPAKLWISHTGTPRVTVTCLKCGREFGARVKREEWRHFDRDA